MTNANDSNFHKLPSHELTSGELFTFCRILGRLTGLAYGAKGSLHTPPGHSFEQVGMVVDQGFQQIPAKAEEPRKFLWKNVVVMHGEPRLGGDLLFVANGRWQLAKIAIGHPAELVVVVENHASVAHNAKVLRKEVARKDVRRGKVLNSLAIVNHRSTSSGFVRFGKIKIQRAHAPLNIKVLNKHRTILDAYRIRRAALQLLE